MIVLLVAGALGTAHAAPKKPAKSNRGAATAASLKAERLGRQVDVALDLNRVPGSPVLRDSRAKRASSLARKTEVAANGAGTKRYDIEGEMTTTDPAESEFKYEEGAIVRVGEGGAPAQNAVGDAWLRYDKRGGDWGIAHPKRTLTVSRSRGKDGRLSKTRTFVYRKPNTSYYFMIEEQDDGTKQVSIQHRVYAGIKDKVVSIVRFQFDGSGEVRPSFGISAGDLEFQRDLPGLYEEALSYPSMQQYHEAFQTQLDAIKATEKAGWKN